jgi:hypothetical protein
MEGVPGPRRFRATGWTARLASPSAPKANNPFGFYRPAIASDPSYAHPAGGQGDPPCLILRPR